MYYERVCDDGSTAIVVRETDEPVVVTPGEPLVPPPPDPAELARELYGEMIVRLLSTVGSRDLQVAEVQALLIEG